MDDCEPQCRPDCDWVFGRLRVSPQMHGGSLVEWEIHPQFRDEKPHKFQLQVSDSGVGDADAWTNVGAQLTNTYHLIDPYKRSYGKWNTAHYRVKMTTYEGVYYSQPQLAMGGWSRDDWNKVREIVRLENLRLKQGGAGNPGYLLKRRQSGEVCPTCTDPLTGEINDAQCQTCLGTGFVDGYYFPVGCVYVDLNPTAHRSHLDDNRGTVDDAPVLPACRMLNVPQVFSYDVWVDRFTDHRWIIHTVRAVAEVRGIPIVLNCEFRLAPFDHPVYSITIPSQVS